MGVRFQVNGGIGYASTSELTPQSIEEVMERAMKTARAMRGGRGLTPAEILRTKERLRVKVDPLDIPPEEKVSLALDANGAAWVGDEIKNAVTMLGIARDLRLHGGQRHQCGNHFSGSKP